MGCGRTNQTKDSININNKAFLNKKENYFKSIEIFLNFLEKNPSFEKDIKLLKCNEIEAYMNQNEELLNNLYKLLKQHSGNCSIILHLDTENQRIQKLLLSKYPITITNALLDLLRELFGNKNVWLT